MKTLTITKALKAHAVKSLGVAADADDAAVKAAVRKAVGSGSLSVKELTKLSKADAPPAPAPKAKPKSVVGLTAEAVEKIAAKAAADALAGRDDGDGQFAFATNPMKAIAPATRVRVKSAAERYDGTTSKVFHPPHQRKDGGGPAHPNAGQPAVFGGRQMETQSQRDKAVIGAWFKAMVGSQTRDLPSRWKMTAHDHELLTYALHEYEWSGTLKSGGETEVHRTKLSEYQIKTLLDDTLSGGIEITPSVFDDAIITYPLLNGELFPYITLKPTTARRIKSGSISNPTITSGTPEGTPIVPIDTSNFIRGFDTPIFPAAGAMTIGLDFEEDSPVDVGGTIIQLFQEVALAKFDYWVANGTGYNEPLGLFNTPGVTAFNTDNGLGGPPTVSDYEAAMAGVAKQYRSQAGAVLAYISNDTTYFRSRGIKVGVTDQRRVFGMEHANYTTLGKPHKIQNDIANNRMAFANLRRYRMYQRAGTTVRVVTEGATLAKANEKLILVRMRFGGQMEDAAAMCATADAQD